MNPKRVFGIGISGVVLLLSSYLLLTASSLLTLRINNENTLPLGTFITWFGIMAFPCLIYFITGDLYSPKTELAKGYSKILKAFIVLAVVWLPIGVLLAGNWSFSFSEKSTFQGGPLAFRIFWYFNYLMVLAPVILVLSFKLMSFFRSLNTHSRD